MASSFGKIPTMSKRCLISLFNLSNGLARGIPYWRSRAGARGEVHVGEYILAGGVHLKQLQQSHSIVGNRRLQFGLELQQPKPCRRSALAAVIASTGYSGV